MVSYSRVLLVENRFHHPKDNTIRLNRSCKDGRCSLIGIEECVANVFRSQDLISQQQRGPPKLLSTVKKSSERKHSKQR